MAKQIKQKDILEAQRRTCMLKRVQRYTGLRKSSYKNEENFQPIALGPDERQLCFKREPIFLFLDCEFVEKSNRVFEVGIAKLDTRQLALRESGLDQWASQATFHHYVLKGFEKYRHAYCETKPGHFDFGETEFVASGEMNARILSHIQHDRAHVLVLHAATNDKKYLKKLGCDFTSMHNVIDLIDTQLLPSAIDQSPVEISSSGRPVISKRYWQLSLHALLAKYRVPYENLHNAGNDAYYTMRALLGMIEDGVGKDLNAATHCPWYTDDDGGCGSVQ